MYNFKGKVALITGGSDGIGLAAAEAFVNSGAKVLIAARDAARGEKALRALTALGGDAIFLSTDVADPEQVARMVATCVEKFGRLDFAVNNAAAEFPLVLTADIPLDAVDRSIAVDLRGAWLCMKYEIEHMLKQGGGAIVNVSSVNGFLSSPNAAIYSATKHGMNGLTTAAAKEYISKGIRINSVCPGAIETPRRERRLTGFTQTQIDAHYADINGRVPAGRVGRAEEVAAGLVWLCSDAAS
ncbi:MAG: SDR family NAD(P)-dependent oxidoreductase, partial [Usitatibacteraceae bacterium]